MSIIHNDRGEPIIQIANEFTVIQVGYTRTGSGERLVVTSPRLGFQTHLDPLQLESLTWQTPDMYSELLDTPYGPGSELKASPLSALFRKD
ncbi:hypothetical protein [Rhodococcus pyridinivorans]|uniref:Dihydrodiol dehydrogenase n=1 Tax=Rhodococcus pyridinivorans TaxID=103816 RepID=A0A7M2XVB1_9NOCA|nr:hypothetical protein [Rhodococcus pyridinivorans]QOW01558.1 dihydrodiol dehydrogenase [Rhodococcus pyridinivorans]